MNPDYYKTNETELYENQVERITKMDDYALEVRYGKMKKPEKIAAFYEALVEYDRAPRVRKRIEKDGCVSPVQKEEPMKFVKVFRDESIPNGQILRQAIFTHKGRFFLYSYSKQPQNNIDETMVFRCDEEGEHDGRELFFGDGYIHSKDAMIGTQANLDSRGETPIADSFSAEMKVTNSNYALDA